MKINPVNFNRGFLNPKGANSATAAFRGKKDVKPVEHDKENPVNEKMEQLLLIKGAIVASLGVAAHDFFEMDWDGEMVGKYMDTGKVIADKKYSHLNKNLRSGLGIASGIALVLGAIAIIGGIDALTKIPKAMYQGKINAHKKSEEMDVYLGQNRIEKDLYEQVTSEAKKAQTEEDLGKVEKQYFLLKQAKTQIPAFVEKL